MPVLRIATTASHARLVDRAKIPGVTNEIGSLLPETRIANKQCPEDALVVVDNLNKHDRNTIAGLDCSCTRTHPVEHSPV